MKGTAQFPQADNLEFAYQVFCDLSPDGLNRYTFAEKYNLHDRQGAYYLNALCFIGVAEKQGKNTYLNKRGQIIQMLDEPFRKKVFLLAIFENQFICDAYQECKDKERTEQKQIVSTLIDGAYGISEAETNARRTRTLMSWFRWFGAQEFIIEEKYNE